MPVTECVLAGIGSFPFVTICDVFRGPEKSVHKPVFVAIFSVMFCRWKLIFSTLDRIRDLVDSPFSAPHFDQTKYQNCNTPGWHGTHGTFFLNGFELFERQTFLILFSSTIFGKMNCGLDVRNLYNLFQPKVESASSVSLRLVRFWKLQFW